MTTDGRVKVAGVTFPNSNGEKRQEILKTIGFGCFTAMLVQTTFEGERAVEVRIKGQMIGYIPKNQLSNPLSHYGELTALISFYKNKWYCVLSERETPSNREYAAMKSLCLKSGVPMPAYDRRAYASYSCV